MSNSLLPRGLQHTRPPSPSLSPRVCSNSLSLSWWCHSTISTCCPLFLLPSIFPNIRVFSNELALHIVWPRYWRFSFSLSPNSEYSGLISLRIDCFDLCAVQGTLKSLLQHHSSKASLLQCSAFFTVQLSHSYMTMGKTRALTRRNKHLLISWLQSPSTVILEPPKNKVSHHFPIYLPWSDGTGCHDLSFLNTEL